MYHHFRSKARGVFDGGAVSTPRAIGLALLAPLRTDRALPTAWQGWIPRTGLQYGADYVLYQRHPALTHSDYTVVVVPLAPGQRPSMGWHDLQVSNRLSTQVSKKLLLLYVQEPAGGAHRSTPHALAQVAVHERLVRRWVPESHRPPLRK